MSWSQSTQIVKKRDAERVINELRFPAFQREGEEPDPAMYEQFCAAKRAAIELLKTVPGPYVSVQMSGHANGVGWQRKEGYANDYISVYVGQAMEEDANRQ
jgi:hypothetical protein